MESLGKYLKAVRESQNLSLKEVFASTRIREHFLRAIEEDRYELLPSGYRKGFLNAYARCLGLNPNDLILWYQRYTEKPAPSRGTESGQGTPSPRKRVNLQRLAIPIFAILFVAILIYYASLKLPQLFSPPPPNHHEVETRAAGPSERDQTSRPGETGAIDPVLKESGPFEVLEAGLGTGIERKDDFLTLTGRASEFVCNDHEVYFLTRIKAKNEGKIFHVWLWQGKESHRKEMDIKPPEWSVYSFITLRPNHSGDWKAEVRDGDKVIAALGFKAIDSTHRKKP